MVDFRDEVTLPHKNTQTPAAPASKKRSQKLQDVELSLPPESITQQAVVPQPTFPLSLGAYHSPLGLIEIELGLDGESILTLSSTFPTASQSTSTNTYRDGAPFSREGLASWEIPFFEWAYILALEKLASLQISKHTEYLRVIKGEFARIEHHLECIGKLLAPLYSKQSPLREALLHLAPVQALSHLLADCTPFCADGGTWKPDAPWLQMATRALGEVERTVERWNGLLPGNEILITRLQNIGTVSGSDGLRYGFSGAALRASGVSGDLRSTATQGVYPRLAFSVPLGADGDAYDRMMMWLLECRQSVTIIKQALKELANVPPQESTPLDKIKLASREVIIELEAPQGVLSCYLQSLGGSAPHYCHFNTPGLIHLTTLQDLCKGHTLADAGLILGSLGLFREGSDEC